MSPTTQKTRRTSGGLSNIDQLSGQDRSDHRRQGQNGQAELLPIVISAIRKGEGEVRVTLDEFKGHLTIDVRLFEPFTPAQVPMPTKKGVTLGLAKLPELAGALAQAETRARGLGLL